MTFEQAKDLCDDVRLIVDDDLVGLTKSERRKISTLLTAYEAQAAELRNAKEYIAATEFWQLDPHDSKERTAYFKTKRSLFPALSGTDTPL